MLLNITVVEYIILNNKALFLLCTLGIKITSTQEMEFLTRVEMIIDKKAGVVHNHINKDNQNC